MCKWFLLYKLIRTCHLQLRYKIWDWLLLTYFLWPCPSLIQYALPGCSDRRVWVQDPGWLDHLSLRFIAACALRLNSWAGTDGLTVSSLNCDRWLILGLEALSHKSLLEALITDCMYWKAINVACKKTLHCMYWKAINVACMFYVPIRTKLRNRFVKFCF